jgi:regulator of sirC expression with transglutaminase-like and TPR domain
MEFWKDLAGEEMEFQDSFLLPVDKKQILCRMLRNLKGIYLEQQNYKKLLPVLDKLVALSPEDSEEIRDRGIIYYQLQAYQLALKDLENYLSTSPDAEDAEIIQQYLQILREYSSHLN